MPDNPRHSSLLRRRVNCERHSLCGSARLRDLDWTHWFTDGGIHTGLTGSVHVLYLHVRRIQTDEGATWHRVHPRRPRGYEECSVRLLLEAGVLYWLLDKPPRR